MIRVRVDESGMKAALADFSSGHLRGVLGRAVARTLEEARRIGGEMVRSRFHRPEYATSRMVTKAQGLKGRLSVSDSPKGLITFKVKPRTRPPHNPPGGISASVRRASAEQLPHAFVGRGQLFQRISSARYPIKRLVGPGGAQMLASKFIAPKLESRIQLLIARNLDNLLT